MFQLALVLYLEFVMESVIRGFLISNISAGNITLCLAQHLARELRFERVRSKAKC